MNQIPTRLLVRASTLVLVVTGHFVLLHVLAAKNVVAVIFAAGPHSPRWALAIAGVFIAMRLLVVLLLPGAILARVGMWLFTACSRLRKPL